MVDQNALDLLLSIDTFRTANKEIEIFAKFLNEEYDADDLIFFLFVRSCIEKEMKMMFIEKAREEIKVQYNEYKDEIDTELYLNIKVCLKIANTIFGNEEELLLNSFMEKVEKQIILNNQAGKKKNLIKASTILEITLEDYHQSRKLYGQDTSIGNFDKTKQVDGKKMSLTDEKLKDENLFDEFYDDNQNSGLGNLGTKRVSLNKLEINEQSPQVEKNEGNNQEKINKLKTGIFNYIKEKELDTFFERLMTSYPTNDRKKEEIEQTLVTIKDLVGKKLALLISIILNQDQENWFISLKIKEEDAENKIHYASLQTLVMEMFNYNSIADIPENIIEEFGQTLLSTPELINQINRLIIKHFG